jgi:hypothetical protein
MLAGRVCTQVTDETPCCFGLGPQGCCVCLPLIPLGIYHPLAGFGIFCVLSNCLRDRVVKKYNVEEENSFCCGSWNGCLNYCHFGCNYPVSFETLSFLLFLFDYCSFGYFLYLSVRSSRCICQ